MIDDVLKDIREAEDKADEIIRLANQKGKEIVAKAETDAQAQKRATLKECKDDRKKALELANEQARKKREAALRLLLNCIGSSYNLHRFLAGGLSPACFTASIFQPQTAAGRPANHTLIRHPL